MGRRFIRSDNLRPAPAWITPRMVKQIVDLAAAAPPAKQPVPVIPVPTPRVKPTLRLVEAESRPPLTHSRRAEGEEAAAPAVSPPRQTKPACEAKLRPARQAVCDAAPREPAPPPPQQARAQQSSDRERLDRAAARKTAQIRSWAHQEAEKRIEKGLSAGAADNVQVRLAQRAIEERQAQEHRQTDPIERAKTLLRRRYAPVCSMAVYDGDPDLYVVGNRRDVTAEELIAMAERFAA